VLCKYKLIIQVEYVSLGIQKWKAADNLKQWTCKAQLCAARPHRQQQSVKES